MDLNSSIPQPEDMSILQPITISIAQPTASSITEASTSLNKKFGKLISRQESDCTIFRVHRHLREVNPIAYEPKVIAIGPYHRGKVHLKMMEDHKLRNLQSLIKRKGCKIETFANAVGGLESEARKCYADQDFNLGEREFIEMLVLDGCFIIELVRNYEGLCSDHENKSMLRLGWMIVSLQRDLVLFENQIPFFILRELFDLIVGPHQHSQLLRLLSKFLCNFYPTKECGKVANVAPHEIKHVLDLVHHTLLPPSHSSKTLKEKEFQFITSATGLREANVKFEKMKEEARMFDIEFKDGVMVMAPLLIGDDTECFLRNLIVYEQNFQHYPHNFVTYYVAFLDSLINSSKDVELLTRKGIIENWLGDDEVVSKMVNRLCDSVVIHDRRLIHYYAQICEDVNEHCRKPWNWRMAKLRRTYLHSPWAIISVLGAVVLLLLTITQTVLTILQVVEKH